MQEVMQELRGLSFSRCAPLLQEGALLRALLASPEATDRQEDCSALGLCLCSLLLVDRAWARGDSGGQKQTSLDFFRNFRSLLPQQCRGSFSEVEAVRCCWEAMLGGASDWGGSYGELSSAAGGRGEDRPGEPPVLRLLAGLLTLSSCPPTVSTADLLAQPAFAPRLRWPLLLLLLAVPPSAARSLLQAVLSSPLASSHLLQLVQTATSSPSLLQVLIDAIIGEMHHSVSTCSAPSFDSSSSSSALHFASPEERSYTCLLSQLCRDCCSSRAFLCAVRTRLAGLHFAPQLCLEITQTYLHDAQDFLATLLPSLPSPSDSFSHTCCSQQPEEGVENLKTHWLFSVLSFDQSADISQGMIIGLIAHMQAWQSELSNNSCDTSREIANGSRGEAETTDRVIAGWRTIVREVYNCLRVCCALMSTDYSSSSCLILPLASFAALTTAVHDLTSVTVSGGQGGGLSSSLLPPCVLAASLQAVFHIRVLACLTHVVYLSYSCRSVGVIATTNAAPSFTSSSAFTSSGPDAAAEAHSVAVLNQMATLLVSPFHREDAQVVYDVNGTTENTIVAGDLRNAYMRFSYFSFHMKLCVSLPLAQDCGTALLPPATAASSGLLQLLQRLSCDFLGLSPTACCLSPASHALLAASLQRLLSLPPQSTLSDGSSPSALLLQRDGRRLVSEFFALSVPDRICAGSEEFTGDWMCSLHALLKAPRYSCLMLQHEGSALRALMLRVLRTVVCPPIHAHLQAVIDLWLHNSVDPTPLPSRESQTRMRCVIPVYPNDIKTMVDPLLNPSSMSAWSSLTVSSSEEGKSSILYFIERCYGVVGGEINAPGACGERGDAAGTGVFSAPSGIAKMKQLVTQVTNELLRQKRDGTGVRLDRPSTAAENSAPLFRAAIACYISLKYTDICQNSHNTNFTAVFACDARALPLRPALALFLQGLLLAKGGAATASHPVPDAASSTLLSSFVQLVSRFCPEVLVRERTAPVVAAATALLCAPLHLHKSEMPGRSVSSAAATATATVPETAATEPSKEVLLEEVRQCIFFCRSLQVPLSLLLATSSADRAVDVVTALLREVVKAAQLKFTEHDGDKADEGHFTENVSSKQSSPCKYDVATACERVWRLWRGTHAMLACPSRLELATARELLLMGDLHRPRGLASYTVLVQEPLLLLRLPLSLLRVPLAFKLVRFVYHSLSVASESAARESSFRMLRLKEWRQKEAVGDISDEWQESETGGSGYCDEFLNLQGVITVRILLELWVEINYHATLPGRNTNDLNEVDDTCRRKSFADMVRRSADAVGSDICEMISSLITDNSERGGDLLSAVLHCGISHWTAFRLLAYPPPSSSRGPAPLYLVDGIAKRTLHVLRLSLGSEQASPLSCSSSSLETWLWHVIFLLKVRRGQMQHHTPITASNPRANQWITKLAESLYSFFKKSAHYSWWSVLPLVGQSSSDSEVLNSHYSLGDICIDLLVMLSGCFPVESLKIVHFFSCHDLAPANLPSTHLFTTPRMRERLATLWTHLCRAYDPYTHNLILPAEEQQQHRQQSTCKKRSWVESL